MSVGSFRYTVVDRNEKICMPHAVGDQPQKGRNKSQTPLTRIYKKAGRMNMEWSASEAFSVIWTHAYKCLAGDAQPGGVSRKPPLI